MTNISSEIEDILEKSLNNERLSSDECLKTVLYKGTYQPGNSGRCSMQAKTSRKITGRISSTGILITRISVHRVVNFAPLQEKLNIAMDISSLKILYSGKLKKHLP